MGSILPVRLLTRGRASRSKARKGRCVQCTEVESKGVDGVGTRTDWVYFAIGNSPPRSDERTVHEFVNRTKYQ